MYLWEQWQCRFLFTYSEVIHLIMRLPKVFVCAHIICIFSTNKKKPMKYLLVDDFVFSLKSGGSPSFDRSLFTDTELDTCELVLTLKTQRTEEKINNITGVTSVQCMNSLCCKL